MYDMTVRAGVFVCAETEKIGRAHVSYLKPHGTGNKNLSGSFIELDPPVRLCPLRDLCSETFQSVTQRTGTEIHFATF